jgi:ParB family chromosome partitioning protein
MKRKDLVRSLLTPDPSSVQGEAGSTGPTRVAAGAVRAMGLELQRLTEQAGEAEALRRHFVDGTAVVELDPSLLESSFVTDRLAPTGDPAYRQLVASIKESGQQIPILVRPHPQRAGFYQIAYGHRRWHAARELGVTVRAIVKVLGDPAFVVAQGKENAERRNLSFIERAFFAASLEERGFDRPTINAALGVQSAETSRLLAIASSVPIDLVRAIGPAPKAGRPRWMELTGLLRSAEADQIVARILAQPGFTRQGSDARFDAVIAALRGSSPAPPRCEVITNAQGDPVIRVERTAHALTLSVDTRTAHALGAYLVESLPELVQRFEADAASRSD